MPKPTVANLAVRRFQYLLGSLLLLIVVQPFLRGVPGRMALTVLFSAIILSAVWGLHRHPRVFGTGIALTILALAGNWIGIFVENLPIRFASRGLIVVILGLVIWTLLTDIARQTRIQPETIYQAACVYMIFGVIFALCYASVSEIDPEAFNPVPAPAAATDVADPGVRVPPLAKWIYFSFVTLTTVGYGDITPIAPAARSLVIVEALLGQFFVAVLVARLVGLLQTQAPRD
jgi:voltage-gated potassium channel